MTTDADAVKTLCRILKRVADGKVPTPDTLHVAVFPGYLTVDEVKVLRGWCGTKHYEGSQHG